MRQKLLIGAAFCGTVLLSTENVGAACTPSPSCTELGYTKTQSECGDDGIKCPFGNLWSCSNNSNKEETVTCQVGSIYYTDGTCSINLISGKTSLGVVVYVTDSGKHGQVMAAKDVGTYAWANTVKINIPSLSELSTADVAAQDFDSCNNTDKIIAQGDSTKFPAAWAARNYLPAGGGRWCLPAAGVLTSIYNNQTAVQSGISKLSGTAFPSSKTLSSSEYNDSYNWASQFNSKYGLDPSYKSTTGTFNYVRPVLEF